MTKENPMKSKTLFVLGVAALALRGVLQTVVDRAGRSTDFTDFAFGVLFGVGIGLLILCLWRMRPTYPRCS
jgi:hypothetical protein